MILLREYHAINKQTIVEAYESAATIVNDNPAVEQLLGLSDPKFFRRKPVSELKGYVENGDIIIFHSNKGSELAHVALVLDNFEKLWVASHWSIPKDKMIKITPNQIFVSSKISALKQFNEEVQEIMDRTEQQQTAITELLELSSTSVEALAGLKNEDMFDCSYDRVQELMRYTKNKRVCEYKDFSEFDIQRLEKDIVNQVYIKMNQLIQSFESSIEKYKENEEVLGMIFDYLNCFDNTTCFYSPLSSLEYLMSDSVMVSTKFRRYFEE